MYQIVITALILVLSSSAYADRNRDSVRQYETAMLTAISSGQIHHKEMAKFANEQLHQAAMCLFIREDDPLSRMAEINQNLLANESDTVDLVEFESIREGAQTASLHGRTPCISYGAPVVAQVTP